MGTRAALFILCLTLISTPLRADAEARYVNLTTGKTVYVFHTRVYLLPGGELGLGIEYVSAHPLNSEEINQEYAALWYEFIPQLKSMGYTHGLLRAYEKIPAPNSEHQSTAIRACLTPTGETLWPLMNGHLHPEDAASNRGCAPSSAPPRKPDVIFTPRGSGGAA